MSRCRCSCAKAQSIFRSTVNRVAPVALAHHEPPAQGLCRLEFREPNHDASRCRPAGGSCRRLARSSRLRALRPPLCDRQIAPGMRPCPQTVRTSAADDLEKALHPNKSCPLCPLRHLRRLETFEIPLKAQRVFGRQRKFAADQHFIVVRQFHGLDHATIRRYCQKASISGLLDDVAGL